MLLLSASKRSACSHLHLHERAGRCLLLILQRLRWRRQRLVLVLQRLWLQWLLLRRLQLAGGPGPALRNCRCWLPGRRHLHRGDPQAAPRRLQLHVAAALVAACVPGVVVGRQPLQLCRCRLLLAGLRRASVQKGVGLTGIRMDEMTVRRPLMLMTLMWGHCKRTPGSAAGTTPRSRHAQQHPGMAAGGRRAPVRDVRKVVTGRALNGSASIDMTL